mmetsp:Transcript_48071/g.112352  ORF Transcript_48071/g.112352 Transcript_48071/m.112352 type:complete len:333 (+) Transcript_48071:1146-2144(+)
MVADSDITIWVTFRTMLSLNTLPSLAGVKHLVHGLPMMCKNLASSSFSAAKERTVRMLAIASCVVTAALVTASCAFTEILAIMMTKGAITATMAGMTRKIKHVICQSVYIRRLRQPINLTDPDTRSGTAPDKTEPIVPVSLMIREDKAPLFMQSKKAVSWVSIDSNRPRRNFRMALLEASPKRYPRTARSTLASTRKPINISMKLLISCIFSSRLFDQSRITSTHLPYNRGCKSSLPMLMKMQTKPMLNGTHSGRAIHSMRIRGAEPNFDTSSPTGGSSNASSPSKSDVAKEPFRVLCVELYSPLSLEPENLLTPNSTRPTKVELVVASGME